MEIVALQETHREANGVQEVVRYLFFESGGHKRKFGTGFIVGPNLKKKAIHFKNYQTEFVNKEKVEKIRTCSS